MANMSYCRFQNTSNDLQDCVYSLEEENHLSTEEFSAMQKMISIATEFLELAEDYKNSSNEKEEE